MDKNAMSLWERFYDKMASVFGYSEKPGSAEPVPASAGDPRNRSPRTYNIDPSDIEGREEEYLDNHIKTFGEGPGGWVRKYVDGNPGMRQAVSFGWSSIFADSEKALLYWADDDVRSISMDPKGIDSLLNYMEGEKGAYISMMDFSSGLSSLSSYSRLLHEKNPAVAISDAGNLFPLYGKCLTFAWDPSDAAIEVKKEGLEYLAALLKE